MLLNLIFIVLACLFATTLVLGKLFVFKFKDTMFVSNYVAMLAIFMGLYCLSGAILMFVTPYIKFKLMLMFFSLSPFVLGRIATYKTERIFSIIQILLVIMSIWVCAHYL